MAEETISTPQAPIAPAPVAAAPSAPAIESPAPQVNIAPAAPVEEVAPVTVPEVVTTNTESSPEKSPVVESKPKTILGSEPVKKTDAKIDAKTEEKTDIKPDAEKAPEAKKEDKSETKSIDGADKTADTIEEKKEEAVKTDEPAPTPTYEAFKLPEGISADEKGLGEFTGLLSEIELAKGDHTKMQEYGQKLVDRHIAEVQHNLKKQQEYFVGLFEKQKIEWKEKFLSDPEIGGNRWETSARAANEFITTHGGSEDQQKELRQLMESTGLGNHPSMIRMLAKATVNMTSKPLPATRPESSRPASKVERRYGKTT